MSSPGCRFLSDAQAHRDGTRAHGVHTQSDAMTLPQAFVENVTHALGDRGREWLESLPSLLAWCEREYGVRAGSPFELSYNYVAPVALADGSEAVLKLSPHGEEFRHELRATRYFDGHGMARLL